MHTIVVNSQKGGSGKTTLCAHLSVQAQRAGDGEVFLIDTDPQGTLTTWHEKREAEAPRRVELPASITAPATFGHQAWRKGSSNSQFFRHLGASTEDLRLLGWPAP